MTTVLPTFFGLFSRAYYILFFIIGWLFFSFQSGLAQPTVIAPVNQLMCAGANTKPVNFAGTGTIYTWTNNNPAIGLPSSGTNTIPAFTAINTTSVAQQATITVTPLRVSCAYIANSKSNTVSVINTNTNQVVATIPVGKTPRGVSVSPDGNRVYVTNFDDNTLSVINTGTNSVTATIAVGSNPYGVCVQPDGSRVYVANNGSDNVSVINTATNSVVYTIKYFVNGTPLGKRPIGICVSPDGTRLYVACDGKDDFSTSIIIYATSNYGLIDFGQDGAENLTGIVVNPSQSRIYAADNTLTRICGSSCIDVTHGSIEVLKANGDRVDPAFVINVKSDNNSRPYGLAMNPDGSRLYVSIEGTNQVKVINTATNAVTATIPVGITPTGISLSADGSQLYVVNNGVTIRYIPLPIGGEYPVTDRVGGTVSVINTITNTVSATIAVGDEPISMGNFVGPAGVPENGTPVTFTITVNPQPPTVNKPEDQVVCTNAASLPVNFNGTANGYTWTNNNPAIGLPASGLGTVPAFVASAPQSATLTVTPRRAAYAYVPTYSGSGVVNVINTLSKAIVTSIPVGQFPKGISVSPDGTRVYVVNSGSSTVSVIDALSNAVVSTIPVGTSPFGAVVSPDGHFIYVSNENAGTVSVIGTETNAVMATIPVGSRPMGIVVTPDGSRVYVANYGSNTVSAINASTRTVIKTIPVGTGPVGMAIGYGGQFMLVTNAGSNNASIMDIEPASTAYHTVAFTITVGQRPQGVSVGPDGSRFYIANSNSNSLTVFDLTDFSLTTVPVGTNPSGVSVSDDGSQVFVANFGSTNITVLNASTNLVISTIDVGTNALSIGNFVGPAGCAGTSQTFVITVKNALTTHIAGSVLACTSTPNSLTATGGGTYLWNTGATSSTIAANTSGTYSVTVSSGQCTATATASVTATPSQVAITSAPPASIDADWHTNVSIPVGVSGAYAQYQWFKDGVSLGTAQQMPTLALPTVQLDQTGSYSLVVTNVCNSVTAVSRLNIVLATRYVKPQSSGRGDGSTWADATANMQAMIDGYKVSQVWVASGLYKPVSNYDRTVSIHMKSGVSILGGFPGSGTPTLTDRNPASYTSTLSGDISPYDTYGEKSSLQVIRNEGVDNTAVLDGFIIQDGFFSADDYRAGVTTYPGGAGMYNANSSPRVINCMFLNNFAYKGGAIYNLNSSPTLINCIFSGNYADDGSGINNINSLLTMINCSFGSNTLYPGAQSINNENNSSTNLTNCIMWDGGGQNDLTSGENQPSPNFTANYCILDPAETDYTGANNRTTDPLFVDAGNNNLQLQAGSPAINAGSNSSYSTASGPSKDLGSNPRILGGLIDMGAYELPSDLTPVLFARPSTITGTRDVSVVVDVFELNGVATNGSFVLRISRDPKVRLTLPAEATSVGGKAVQNSAWSLSSPLEGFYTLTPNQSITAAGILSVGLVGTMTPGATTGSMTVSTTVLPGSLVDADLGNNQDADKVEYFQQ